MATAAVKVRNPLEVEAITMTAVATTSTYFNVDTQDERTAILVANSDSSNAVNLTIEAGDGYAASTNEVLSIPANGTSVFYINSNRFKITSGTNKGAISVKAATASKLTLAVIGIGVAADDNTPDYV